MSGEQEHQSRHTSGRPRFVDLETVEVEQLLPIPGGASVAMRCRGGDAVLLGRFTPDQARAIAVDLISAAARAEYEADFDQAASRAGYTFEAVTEIVELIRSSQERREDAGGSTSSSS